MVNVVNFQQKQAVNAINEAGFSNISIVFKVAVEDKGIVIGQYPSPEKLILPDAEVTLTISSGMNENQVGVKKYINMIEADAVAEIESDKFIVGEVTQEYSDTDKAGIVIQQFPEAETVVEQGSTVNLWISLGIKPSVEKNIVVEVTEETVIDPKNLTVIGESNGKEQALDITSVEQKDNNLIVTLEGTGKQIYYIKYQNIEIGSGVIDFDE
jgi:serine/threonine-protein kinase